MKILPGVLIALSITAAPIIWHFADAQFATPPAVDMGPLENDIAALRDEVQRLKGRIDGLDARTSLAFSNATQSPEPENRNPTASDSLKDAFAQVVLIADRRSANDGLTVASPSFLSGIFGLPRTDLTDDCQPATNPKLKALLSTEDVGPIRARMVNPALVSLRQVFANVQVFEPELYDRIKSAGSLCVRLIRGSTSSASAHAYGLAVDINIDGVLDGLADGKTQLGLILLADFFKKEGWIWGAGFGREDSMHFEVSREKLEQWRRQGLI
ncbi:M15 family metallopeptidase [Parasulfitobacter algicola]|uniref:M15 family metallopeptidase n=1 Tax=Parasulfitobacter algicola TaxID=2614809 RepID=A0ABX2ILF8_9RHOB|nr:M15 family metallopeptidase [Sulfitobacter algicola]NSX53697.1 M15 family metallopeptidase [Sulfitobacter algicola]